MPRLIWVFTGRTGHFVGFVMLQIICFRDLYQHICNIFHIFQTELRIHIILRKMYHSYLSGHNLTGYHNLIVSDFHSRTVTDYHSRTVTDYHSQTDFRNLIGYRNHWMTLIGRHNHWSILIGHHNHRMIHNHSDGCGRPGFHNSVVCHSLQVKRKLVKREQRSYHTSERSEETETKQFEPPHYKTNKMMWTQWELRSAWASTQSDQSLHSGSVGGWGPNVPSCGQRRLWSDWADAQADLSLRWAHWSFCWFCHEAAQSCFGPLQYI